MDRYAEIAAVLALLALLAAAWSEPAGAQTAASCGEYTELRVERRVLASGDVRLYVGCRDYVTAVPLTWYVDLDGWGQWSLRYLGERLRAETTWKQPWQTELFTFQPAVELCDRWYLWADDEGARAPAMTRKQKLAQACGP